MHLLVSVKGFATNAGNAAKNKKEAGPGLLNFTIEMIFRDPCAKRRSPLTGISLRALPSW
jgi:hypothetical protein